MKWYKAVLIALLILSIPRTQRVLAQEVTVSNNEIVGTVSMCTVETIERPEPLFGQFTEREIDLMAQLVWHEAGNQDMVGKRLVVDTVLNRVEDSRFPNTVEEVIFQKGQYTTARVLGRVEPTIECYGAVLSEIDGERYNTEVLFFGRGWGCGTPLFKHQDHCFSGL
jgi:N-acetylmuramoyl-L-alanine amidase